MTTKKVLSASLSTALSTAIVLGNSLIWIPESQASFEPYEKTFIVTAYYSPLPGQEFYVTGSLASDKRLNGNGTNGADGTPVYPGMIAAPSTYAFGTGIHCPGYIDGEIHDRGGAIVKAGVRSNAHDRLDFWAGHGDEALKTALYWGKRTLTCTVYPPGYRQTDQYVTLPNGPLNMTAKRFLKRPAAPSAPVYTGISSRNKALFKQLGYDPEDKDHRIAFQLRHGIIESADEVVAGNVGPKTSAKLEAIAAEMAAKVPREGLSEDDVDPDVRILQQQLIEMGYLKTDPTAIFGPQTKAALVQYQLDMGLIESADHPAAGYLGPGTYQALADRVLSSYAFSDQDAAQIALLKAEEREAQLIAKADLFAQEAPEIEEEPIEDPDYFKEALEELAKDWIEDHTPEETQLQSRAESTIVFASAIEEQSFNQVREKLTPVVHPFQSHLRLGIVHNDVRRLQTFLKKNGYLEIDAITSYFGIETKKAVRQFQIDQGIVDSIYSVGAGVVGPKTVKVLNALNYDQEFSLPREITNVIRAPAVHPEDLKINAPLHQASSDQKKSL